MNSNFNFTEEEKQQIEDAVRDLEKKTSGELVPYYMEKSDQYTEYFWYSSVLFAGLGALFFGMLSYMWSLPYRITPFDVSISILVLMIFGYFLPVIFPAYRRAIINREKMDMRVQQKASELFLQEEVFNTRERIGILLFISAFEHQVIIIGDKGVSEKLKQEDWNHIVEIVISGIKSNQTAKSIVQAIQECRDLLLTAGFHTGPDDENELSDEIRIN